ncbi:hypothetical protein LCL95_13385 [Bacillus timonensis]|nr:hypothetical protein [Bacillus timonensis]
MAESLVRSRSTYYFAVIALLIISSNLLLMKLDKMGPVTNGLAMVTVIDLTVFLPFFFYLFIVRNRYSPISVLPVIFSGFWLAYFIVPHEHFAYFTHIKYGIYGLEALFVAAEILIFILILKKAKTLHKTYTSYKKTEPYFPIRIRKAIIDTFGPTKVARLWVTDLSIFYYGLFTWRKKWTPLPNVKSFSYHKNTGYFGVFIMLVHAMLIEVVAVHVLVAQWNTLAAWLVTALDIYLLFCIIADYHAIRLSPVHIDEKKMTIQIGIRNSLQVELANIESIEPVTTFDKKKKYDKTTFFVTLPEFIDETPQFLISLKNAETAYLPFGIKREITSLYVTVDDKQAFLESVSTSICIEKQ